MILNLNELLEWLEAKEGCYPCISYRGRGIWRAYVNGAGCYWDEASTPLKALERAVQSWEKAGKPMDGYAAPRGSGCG